MKKEDFIKKLEDKYLGKVIEEVDFNITEKQFKCSCGYTLGLKSPSYELCPCCGKILMHKTNIVNVFINGETISNRKVRFGFYRIRGCNPITCIDEINNFTIDLDTNKPATFRIGNRKSANILDNDYALIGSEKWFKASFEEIKKNSPDIYYKTGLKEYLDCFSESYMTKLYLLFRFFQVYTKKPSNKSIELLLKAGYKELSIQLINTESKYRTMPEFKTIKDLLPLPKNLLKLFKQGNLADRYIYDRLECVVEINKYYRLSEKEALWVYENQPRHLLENAELVFKKYNYNLSSIILYIEKKCNVSLFESNNAMYYFVDYVRISDMMDLKFDKYPTDIKKAHDEVSNAYSVIMSENEEKFFKKTMEKHKYLEYEDDDFVILLPKKPLDLAKEGTNQRNCVSTYARRVAEEKCVIVFMRKKEDPNSSYITIEVVNNNPVQIRGFANSIVSNQKELNFINKWKFHIQKKAA